MQDLKLPSDGRLLRAPTLSAQELYRWLLPLREWVLQVLAKKAKLERVLVGIAGPGGAGKTTFAHLLQRMLQATAEAGEVDDFCVVVGMDGYHFPSSYLDSHQAPDPDNPGAMTPLRTLKGRPESFNGPRFLQDLLSLARIRGGTVSLPAYSRRLHDVQEGGVQVR